MGATSPTAGKLFIIAGILWFAEIPMAIFFGNAIIGIIGAAFGVFFIAGGYFSFHGTMAPIYEKDHMGRPTGRQIGQYEAACYCGLLGLLAIVIAFVSASMVGSIGFDTLPIIIPGLLGGLVAFIAGIVYLKASRKFHKTRPTRRYY